MDVNNLEEIKKLDPKDVYGSTNLFVAQCKQIHDIVSSFEFKQDYSAVKNVVISGMGGSAYGGYVAANLLKAGLKVPLVSNNDYTLPSYVDENTLVFVTSYSGSTEETLASFEEANLKGAKVVGLSAGGKLAENVRAKGYDMVVFDPINNPSGQPRLGTGYIVLGTLEILSKIGLASLSSSEINEAISQVENLKGEIEGSAKSDSLTVKGNIPLLIAAEHLSGNTYIMRNQFNETAKSFASFHNLPELNHHLLEGLKNPEGRKLIGVFFESGFYCEKVGKRLGLTKQVFEKNNTPVVSYPLKTTSKLSQSLELLMYGSYITFYLAIAYNLDPSLIPWVDWFKEQLA